jgi:predicted transcriptional regulator
MPISEEHEEYEIIPVSPIRRLEKKIEKLEAMSPLDNREMFKEVISVIRMNQEIVNQLVKSTDELKNEISKLPIKIDELIKNLNELISLIKASGEEEIGTVSQEAMKPVVDKLDELLKQNKKIAETNESLLTVLDALERKLRKPVVPVVKKPLPSKLIPKRI